MKRWVLRLDRKVRIEFELRTEDMVMSSRALGQTQKARVPMTVRVRGSVRTIADEDLVEYLGVSTVSFVKR